jgi:hypothetical protein
MTIVRTLTSLGVAAIVLCAVAPAQAGQPTSRGKGLGTAATTSGQSSSHVSATPGQAAPASVTPGQGTSTATSTPAGTNPNASKIGQGTTK